MLTNWISVCCSFAVIYTVSQKHATVHSCIALAYVERFSKLFHSWSQLVICNKILVMYPTTPYICCYTTLRNLKKHFRHFPTPAAIKTYIEIHEFLVNVIYIIWHILPQHASDLTSTACHVQDLLRVLYFPEKQRVSSLSVQSLCVSVSHFCLLKWETPTLISSGLWPQHSYMNPVNYKICSEMQQHDYWDGL